MLFNLDGAQANGGLAAFGDVHAGDWLADAVTRLVENGIAQGTGIEHVALINVQKRIRMVCGDGYGVELDSASGAGTRVRLRFARDVGEDALPRRV